MMIISCLAIFLEILSIQRYADASFLPSFSHHGHPMKPHFLGPPIHGPPMILGPPPMYGPPIHGPFHMPSPHLLDPPGPMFPPELMHERFHPRKYLPPHKYVQPISPKVLRPFPHPKRLLPIMKPLSHKKLYKKPRRVLLIKRQNNINFPKVYNPYGYERKLRRLSPFNRERYLAGYESVPRSRYDNNYYRSNSNVPNIPGQRQHSPDRSALNGGSLDYIASGGDVYNNNNNIKSINTRNNENLPRLREVIDSGKRRQIKRNSVRTRNVGGSVKRQSIKRRGQKNNAKGLSGKTIDFSKSTVISSNKNIGTESLSSNLLDKSNTGTHSEQLSIRKESMRSRKNISHISSVTTPIGKKPKNSRPNLKADVNSRPGTGSKHDAGLGGSLIDLSHIGESTGANDPNQTVKLGAGASSLVSAGAGRLGSAVPAAAASAAATDVNANTFANAATAASNLNGNAINSASNLGGVSSSHDLVIIDSSANKRNTLADVAAKAIPEAFNAQGGVVDLTATSGAVSGANLNNLGPNVDVLTLDKNAFAKLEKALQSGQTVDAQLLDSILGNVGSTGALNGGSTSSALSSGNADVGIANAATPEIYFLDTAQAQHLTEFAGFSGNGGASQLAESHTASSTSTSHHTLYKNPPQLHHLLIQESTYLMQGRFCQQDMAIPCPDGGDTVIPYPEVIAMTLLVLLVNQ
ncbi:uncharacterized protein LOC123547201 [Mercenaria mercenaria]|uniref:uncharacterized protein LOC123547201 n=1 Tax=Mercenaria mercenaria TaxID=6596 RepID=UPI00234F8028|nr:uncharacterized protein LOC123547201 [Mercenaria mercenaria]